MPKKRIIAVASFGGHWMQLLRITKPLEEKYEVVYSSTNAKCSNMVNGSRFYKVSDFNRKSAWKMLPACFKALRIIISEKPKAVVTTGAAPGLVFLMVAKMFGIKTIWVDSIANAKHPSASGRIAAKFATGCYTQWPHEADERFKYAGNIFGEERANSA